MRQRAPSKDLALESIEDSVLDNTLRFETPEGTEVEIHPAGVIVRGLALLIDELIRWAVIIGGSILLGMMGSFGTGIGFVVFFLVYWLYGVIFEVLNNGQTPGKRFYGLQVVHDDGTPIRLPASVLRNLLFVADILPLGYLFGVVSMALSKNFQRIGDHVGGTMVVFRRSTKKSAAAQGPEGSRTPPIPLTVDEQSMLLSYLDRRVELSDERVQELSSILAPALDCEEEQADGELQRVAQGVRGVAA